MSVAVLLAAPAPDAGALGRALFDHARGWAQAVAPGAVHELARGEPLAAAAQQRFGDGAGPVLVLWPLVARLGPEHASAALDDLRSGCTLTVGPLLGGGFYLAGLAEPAPALLALPEETWQAPDALNRVVEAAAAAGLEVGLLRGERGLAGPADLQAALVDPLTPPALAELLRDCAGASAAG